MRLDIDDRGRFVVYDERRVYGAYRSLRMAHYRKRQVEASRRPQPGRRWQRRQRKGG